MIAIKKARVDAQAEEARRLGLELDSDDDPAGVVRKLYRSPEGFLLLLSEFTGLQNRIDKYEILFWSQRERLFHCLGKRLRDLFTDDQIITDWVVALMGAVYGDDPPEEKVQAIGEVFDGMLPPWMDISEYQVRIDVLVAAVAGRQESIERVKAYLAAAIRDVTDRLKRAKARARRELKLELQGAWVDDTPSGARRLSYRRGHDRAYESSLKRLKTLQEERRDQGGSPEDDPDDGTAPGETGAAEAGPPVETTGGDGFGPIAPSGKHEIRNPKSEITPLNPQAPSFNQPLRPLENEPIRSVPRDGGDAGFRGSESGVTFAPEGSLVPTIVSDPVPAAAVDRLEIVTNEPKLSRSEAPPSPSPEPQARARFRRWKRLARMTMASANPPSGPPRA